MNAIKLQRLVSKKRIAGILRDLGADMGVPLQVLDSGKRVIFGEGEASGGSLFPLELFGETIGWVAGNEKAGSIASVLTQFARSEMEKKDLGRETLEKYKELTTLYNITEKISACLDIDEVANLVIGEAHRLIQSDSVSVMLFDKNTKELEIIAALGKNVSPKTPLKEGTGIAGDVILRERGEIVNDVSGDSRFVPGAIDISSMMCTPLKIAGEAIGLINLSTIEAHNYRSEDLKLFNALAFQASVAIENARLYGDLRRTFISTVYGLATAIGKRDPYTGKHTKRVMEYSTEIGKEMNLSKKQLHNLQLAAILHDVGKIGIPDYILLKREKLSRDEFEIYKKHPIMGEEIVRNVKQLHVIIPGIRHHHEFFNGKGYPDGAAGFAIDIMARIIAVADAFDAMTSDRPYRKGLNQAIALEHLKKGSNTQFDPEAVKAFLRVFRKKRALFKEK